MSELKKHLFSNAWTLGLIIVFLVIIQLFFGNVLIKMGFMPFVGKCLLYALLILAADMLSYIAYYVIHFGGILLGGLMSGYKLLSLSLLNMCLTRREGKFSFSFTNTNNKVVLGLPLKDYDDQVPYFWVNSTSFFLRILTMAVAIFLVFYTPFNYNDYMGVFVKFLLALYSIIVIFKIGRYLFSLFSSRYRKFATIGEILTVRLLSLEPEKRKIYTHIFQINTLLYEGKSMSEMPEELFDDIPLDNDYTFYDICSRTMFIYRLLDLKEYELAQQAREADKLSFNLNYTMQYFYSILVVEFYNQRRPEILEPLCKYLIMKTLRQSKRFGLLYAFYKVCMLDDFQCQEIKTSFENHKFIIPNHENLEANLIAFIDGLEEEGKLPKESLAYIPDEAPITYKPRQVLYRLMITPLLALVIHYSYLESKPHEDSAEQEYVTVVKSKMINALDVNDCDNIEIALYLDENFRKTFPNSKYIDYDYSTLVEMCKERLKELDCDNVDSIE